MRHWHDRTCLLYMERALTQWPPLSFSCVLSAPIILTCNVCIYKSRVARRIVIRWEATMVWQQSWKTNGSPSFNMYKFHPITYSSIMELRLRVDIASFQCRNRNLFPTPVAFDVALILHTSSGIWQLQTFVYFSVEMQLRYCENISTRYGTWRWKDI